MRLYDLFLELRIGRNKDDFGHFLSTDKRLSDRVGIHRHSVTNQWDYYPGVMGLTCNSPIMVALHDIQKFYAWAEATGYWPQEELDRLLPYVAVDLAGG